MITPQLVDALNELEYPIEIDRFKQVVTEYGGCGSIHAIRQMLNCYCRRHGHDLRVQERLKEKLVYRVTSCNSNQ